jgi:dual specificity tyrosine-phosphorylation-regulated kinase 2/3/4
MVNPPRFNEASEPEPEFPMGVRQCLKAFKNKNRLTDFEKTELLEYEEIYTIGSVSSDQKVWGKPGKNHNYGYDDEQGDYTVVLGDHLAFRFEVIDFLGKGSFGQALKCLDHKTGETVAVKIIRNK